MTDARYEAIPSTTERCVEEVTVEYGRGRPIGEYDRSDSEQSMLNTIAA